MLLHDTHTSGTPTPLLVTLPEMLNSGGEAIRSVVTP